MISLTVIGSVSSSLFFLIKFFHVLLCAGNLGSEIE